MGREIISQFTLSMKNRVFFPKNMFTSYSSGQSDVLRHGLRISVRGMQYVLDMTIITKKPDDLVHELLYKCNRNWPLVLWPYPEDFEKLAYSEKFS